MNSAYFLSRFREKIVISTFIQLLVHECVSLQKKMVGIGGSGGDNPDFYFQHSPETY
jgi:hypothetical protein